MHHDRMVENRKAPRFNVVKVGTIALGGRTANCVVRNLSATGAALEIKSPAGIPARFTLLVPGDRLSLACRIVWRKAFRLGVVFD